VNDEDLLTLLKSRLNRREDQWEDLLVGEQTTHIRQVLAGVYNDVGQQLSSRRSEHEAFRRECWSDPVNGRQRWFEAEGEYNEWRTRTITFLRLIQGRLAMVRAAEKRKNINASADVGRGYRDQVRRLALAIEAHRLATGEPSRADLRLWNVLEEEYVSVGGGEASLSAMLDSTWTDGET
jgi:hypothetical protein